MKAMIFAAGVGSRLKELTRDTPKCLMQVGDKTMLEHVVTRLKEAGVTAVAINVHHHADKVKDFIRSRDNFGLEVLISHESTLLDTGGGLKKVAHFFSGQDTFIIHNADIFSSIDLKKLVQTHRSRKAIGTLAVMERPSQRGLYFDSDDRLIGWTGDNAPGRTGRLLSFCGVSAASYELFSFMGGEESFSIIRAFLDAARGSHRVWGEVVSDVAWSDIGTLEQLEAVRKRYAQLFP